MIGKNEHIRNPLIGILLIGATVFGFKFANAEKSGTANTEASDIAFTEIKTVRTGVSVSAEFDPNELSGEDWQKMGFSEKQAATILKYKDVVGGTFTSKQQLKKCYAISEEAFNAIEPFIILPESAPKQEKFYRFEKLSNQGLNITGKFNPDVFTAADWQTMGFSEKQSAAILKYRDYLGGSFRSKEKFRECFIISDENYKKLEPFLLLPAFAPSENKSTTYRTPNSPGVQHKYELRNFDPNELDVDGWKTLGFSQKQSEVIVNYRNSILKGSFKNLEQIQKCYVISAEKFDELKPFIQLKSESANETAHERNKLQAEAAKTDFTTIDLNEISFNQLREFGFTEKAAAGFIGFRKNLGGFVNENQIFEVYGIDRALCEQLVSTAFLSSSNVVKYMLTDAPESWLKTHPYFRYSADKIIYYRVTYPDDKKIWKQLKTKPEYEAKMRLYLKE